jgi:MYXO-CTERM domain-containing protein
VDTIERDVALDGVTVTVVPAPSAAAALLGLSGLLAARRRR